MKRKQYSGCCKWNCLTMRCWSSSCSGNRGLAPGLGWLAGSRSRGVGGRRTCWRTSTSWTCAGSKTTIWLCPILHWLEQSKSEKKWINQCSTIPIEPYYFHIMLLAFRLYYGPHGFYWTWFETWWWIWSSKDLLNKLPSDLQFGYCLFSLIPG